MTRIACIGDVHGCHEEFKQLLDVLSWFSLDEIWHVGDLVDRGPDSGKVVQIAMERKMPGVMGNHEQSILNHWERYQKTGELPKKETKRRTIKELTPQHVEYLRKLPTLHVIDPLNLVIAHAGVWPLIPLYKQNKNVCRAQLIHPYHPEKSCRWWGPEATNHSCGKTEEESLKDGYRRWYEVWDGPENVVYGHSVFVQPNLHQNEGCGWTCGIDTGNVFGGVLTAAIIEGSKKPFFVSVPPKRVYCADKLGKFEIR